jgi:hypothetical protein
MTRTICKMNYFLILLQTYLSLPNFIVNDYSKSFFLEILNLQNQFYLVNFIFLMLPISVILFSILSMIRPNKYYSSLTFLLFLIYVYIPYILIGKIGHVHLTLIYSSLFIIFIDQSKSLKTDKNFFILRVIQYSILSCYFSAGLWKLRSAISSWNIEAFLNAPLSHIAYGVAEGNQISILISSLMTNSNFQNIIKFGFIFFVIFQLSTLLTIFKPKWIRYFGFFAILFHLSTGLALGIFYSWMALTSLLYLTIAEYVLNTNEK